MRQGKEKKKTKDNEMSIDKQVTTECTGDSVQLGLLEKLSRAYRGFFRWGEDAGILPVESLSSLRASPGDADFLSALRKGQANCHCQKIPSGRETLEAVGTYGNCILVTSKVAQRWDTDICYRFMHVILFHLYNKPVAKISTSLLFICRS